jgi:hypothetical protein
MKKIAEPFENAGVYNIMTQILNLTPARGRRRGNGEKDLA